MESILTKICIYTIKLKNDSVQSWCDHLPAVSSRTTNASALKYETNLRINYTQDNQYKVVKRIYCASTKTILSKTELWMGEPVK